MDVIIIGYGKVGEALVNQLTYEQHNVTVIDCHDFSAQVEQNDAAFIKGNGAKADILKIAGCERHPLLIAVTSSDELNILACSIGKMLGASATIARVRNPDYSSQIHLMKKSLGIDMCINPDLTATGEILKLLRFPSAMTVDSFTRGYVEIVSYRLKENSILDNVALYNLKNTFPANILVCAVERDGKVHIPTGDFVLHSGDRISIIAKRSEIEKFFKQTGTLNKRKIKNVLIIGGSRIGFYLSNELIKCGIGVTLIEQNEDKCEELTVAGLSKKVNLLLGDGSNADFLDEHNISSHDAFISLTGIDEENIVMAMYAAGISDIYKVIAKVNRSSFLNLVKNTDTETYISPKLICANQIVQYVRAVQNSVGSNVETLHTIVDDKIEALEFIVKNGSKSTGIPLKHLNFKKTVLVACITRKGEVITPGGDDTIEVGDSVIIVTTTKGLNDLDDILK